MYTSVQVTIFNTKKNKLAEIDIEIRSNQSDFIEQKDKHGQRKMLPAFLVFSSTTILITFNYLSKTCVEWIFIISSVAMTSTFATLAKFIKIFLICMPDH